MQNYSVNGYVGNQGAYLSITKDEVINLLLPFIPDEDKMKSLIDKTQQEVAQSDNTTLVEGRTEEGIPFMAGWTEDDLELVKLVPQEKVTSVLTECLKIKIREFLGTEDIRNEMMLNMIGMQVENMVALMYQHSNQTSLIGSNNLYLENE